MLPEYVDFNTQGCVIASIWGVYIANPTHLYIKLGASYARFVHQLFVTTAPSFPFPIVSFQDTEHQYLWGWLAGLGVTYDICKWLNTFAEYDYYNYGNRNLNALDNIASGTGGANRDHFTQHIDLNANS